MRLERPWLIAGHVEIIGASEEQVRVRLVERLSDQYKRARLHANGTITFTDNWLVGPNWPALAAFASGRIWIVGDGRGAWVHYRLRCMPLFVFPIVAAILFAIIGSLGTPPQPLRGLALGACAWFWLYCGNMLVIWLRVPGFFRKAAQVR